MIVYRIGWFLITLESLDCLRAIYSRKRTPFLQLVAGNHATWAANWHPLIEGLWPAHTCATCLSEAYDARKVRIHDGNGTTTLVPLTCIYTVWQRQRWSESRSAQWSRSKLNVSTIHRTHVNVDNVASAGDLITDLRRLVVPFVVQCVVVHSVQLS